MNCETCTVKRPPDPVPYLVHEGDMARQERTIKRLWIIVLILILLLAATNGAWIYYESQWEVVETTIEYYSDTDFGQLVEGRRASEVWPVVDELVTEAVRNLNPRLYEAFMRKLRG